MKKEKEEFENEGKNPGKNKNLKENPNASNDDRFSSEDDAEKDYQMDKIKNKSKGASKTPALDNFGRDLTKKAAEGKIDEVVGRKEEIDHIIRILNKRKKNNAVLIGEAGVGKSAVVEGLAQRIANKDVDPSLLNTKIIELSMTSVVAGTKYRGQFEERMEAIMKEASENPEIVIFIDELHNIMGAGGTAGSMDASNILKPALARGEIKVIGATTFDEYQKYIESDKALERRFQPVNVPNPKREEVLQILKNIKKYYENHHSVIYSDEVLVKIVDWSERYIPSKNNPDKAIDLMDEVGSNLRIDKAPPIPEDLLEKERKLEELNQEKKEAASNQDYEKAASLLDKCKVLSKEIEERKLEVEKDLVNIDKTDVTIEDVATIVSKSTGIPANNLTEKENDRLLKMPEELKKNIIDQDDAVDKICSAIQRSRTGVRDPNKPILSALLLGVTGVGKTELSKQLSKFLFGTDKNIIRLDMSEYSMKHEAAKLIGSPPGFVGHDEGGQLTEKVKQRPYSIILFDEIEKAHEDLKNYLLQILDEGRLTDAKGRNIDFKNTIIIMTSNIGTHKIVQDRPMGFSNKTDKTDTEIEQAVISELEKHKMTTPEFINRIDEVVVFKNLTKDGIKKIVNIQLGLLRDRMLKDMNIKVKATNKLVEFLGEVGYSSRYGARPLKRMISKHVENALAMGLMEKKIEQGKEVTLDVKKEKVYIKSVK